MEALTREPVSREIRGHKGIVTCLAWNADGSRLASASADHTVRVWSTRSLDQSSPSSLELRGHSKSIEKIAWNPQDPNELASLSADKTLKIWDLRTGTLAALSLSWPSFSGINLAWSPCGRFLAVGGKDDTLRVLDVRAGGSETGRQARRMSCEVNQIAWGPAGDRLILASGLGTVDVVASGLGQEPLGELLARLPCHTSNAFCLSCPPGSPYFAIGAADALVSLWQHQSGSAVCLRTMGRLEWPVRAVALSPLLSLLAAGGEDGVVDVSECEEAGRRLVAVKVRAPVTSLAWHPKNLVLAVAAEEKDARSGRVLGNFHLHTWL